MTIDMMMGGFGRFRTCVLGLLAFAGVQNCFGYSVLAHEALVDALWDVKIRGLLLAAYPNSTRDEMKKAHGFAYGGAILQDLGYYPHGSPQFSDFTHYVRTGDFIESLIRQSNDLNELAFSLGALSHYLGDNDGHRYATNVAEPILYPR
ncbi:MAG: zinc dependent phospholipase C family protein, partial [Acidobacteriaceae bacterium]|nr:zinc dependent phospholipase C family protein [Acidobacteriaceae bacterium]